MTYPKAIVISAALIAAAIVFSTYQPADAQSAASRFTIAPLPYAIGDVLPGAWVLNTINGTTFLCTLRQQGAVGCRQASYP